MKNFKRLSAIVLAFFMVLTMSNFSFVAKAATSTGTATVNGVKQDASAGDVAVTAYQVLELDQTSTTGWKITETYASALEEKNITVENLLNPTTAQLKDVENAVNNTSGNNLTKIANSDLVKNTGTYANYKAENLTPGMYIIVVSNTATIYNPMVVSINRQGTTITDGVVNAKPENPTIDKSATVDGEEGENHDLQIGDTVNFTVTSIIPAYGTDYTGAVTYKITDEMSSGLTLVENTTPSVVVENRTESEKELPTATVEGQKITVDFTSDFVKANPGAVVTLTYSAKLNDQAVTNFNPNTNEATLEYTNGPGSSTGKVDDKTYTYTFELNGNVFGQTGEQNIYKDIIKVGEDTYEETLADGNKVTKKSPLAGAEFSLFTDEACENEFDTATTGENGTINFRGLDATTYYLKETKAPSGYSLNDVATKVVITANYDNEGKLTNYTITFGEGDNQASSTYTCTYEGETITKVVATNTNETYEFLNTKTSSLPSTGGIGTYIFTIAGVAIMAFAAFMFFMNKKRKKA